MDLGLSDHRVIVTAGAAGIGLATARAFAAEGARVWVCDVDMTAIVDLPSGITGMKCDVSDRAAVDTFMAKAIDDLGGLDCLVNNAGIAGPTGLVEDNDPDAWDACINVCLIGQFNCARRAVPYLRQSQNGSMANLSSLAGRMGFPLRTAYAAAKWGVIGLTKSLSRELGPDGVRVNAILPGLVSGDRQKNVLTAKAEAEGISYADMEARAFSYTSVRTYVPPAQIAAQILFLASRQGRHISGQSLSVCGDTQMLT